MKLSLLIALAATALPGFAADERNNGAIPPVLRPLEPADSSVFRLPGPPLAPPAPTATPRIRLRGLIPPVASPSPLATRLTLRPLPLPPRIPSAPAMAPVVATAPSLPPPPALVTAATVAPTPLAPAEPAKPPLPPEAAQEMAFYCQKRIGQWTEPDARKLLGAPLRSRAAYDERKRANGKIYAFRDPTSRYRELELDFDSKTGTLRTVFVYPHPMTFQDVRRRWRGDVSTADAPAGRKFYSYSNRRLDVLVDAEGKVISLGLY